MKKLWKKFKHWLIQKLGGYVHLEKPCVIHHYTVAPVTVKTVLKDVDYERYHNNPGYRGHIDRLLIGKLEDTLYETRGHFVDICESCPTYSGPLMRTTIDLKASIKVCPKEVCDEPK